MLSISRRQHQIALVPRDWPLHQLCGLAAWLTGVVLVVCGGGRIDVSGQHLRLDVNRAASFHDVVACYFVSTAVTGH